MGLSDREYMKRDYKVGSKKAGWLARVRFFLWRLFHRR